MVGLVGVVGVWVMEVFMGLIFGWVWIVRKFWDGVGTEGLG